MDAAVFAAGVGKRLRPLTSVRPKHLLPLAGKPVLRRILEALDGVGVERAVILVSYLGGMIRDAVSSWGLGLETLFIEQGNPMGTGHALKTCGPHLAGDKFLVVYGDITLTPEVLTDMLDFHGREDGDAVVEAVEVEDVSRYGAIESDGVRFLKVSEKSRSGRGLANAGLYILPRKSLELAERLRRSPRGEYELTDILNMMVDEGLRVLVHRSRMDWWFDIGAPIDYLEANLTIMRREHVKEIGRGARCMGVLEEPYYVGAGSEIGREAVISGSTVMDGVLIGGGSIVKESIILDGCRIGGGCRLTRVIVGDGAVIGDDVEIHGGQGVSVIAPNTRIGSGAKITGGGVYP